MRVRYLAAAVFWGVATSTTLSSGAGPAPRAQKFYAFCIEMGVPGQKPHSLAEQATMLRQLGYDGIGLPLDGNLAANLATLDQAGLPLLNVWTTVDVRPDAVAFGPAIPAAIRQLKGRPVTVSVLPQHLKPDDRRGIPAAVKALRALGDVAAEAGVQLAVYPHTHDWTERLEFAIEVVRKVNHPQVGYQFNLCHWLMVEPKHDFRPLLRENADKLFGISISGATLGTKVWTNGLIRPLDEGDLDLRPLLATLDQIGYKEPVGLQCFGVPGDARDNLARSMKIWRDLHSPVFPGR
jgi:sugar phosphate isomerase/epimerase